MNTKTGLMIFLCLLLGVCGCGRITSSSSAMAEFEGVWYSYEQYEKLEIKKGTATGWHLYMGEYKQDFKVKVKAEDDCLFPVNEDEMLGDYKEFRREGDLLIGVIGIFVLDGPSPKDTEFAREGHEEDLTPLPIYVKEASQVKDRTIDSFSMAAEAYGNEKLFLTAWEGFEEAVEFDLSSYYDGDVKYVTIRIYGEDEKELICTDRPLTPLLEKKLAELLLSPEVMANNPYEDSDDIGLPTIQFRLNAVFGSGEHIAIRTGCGPVIGEETCGEILRLFLDQAE